jgi:hypothetical protein
MVFVGGLVGVGVDEIFSVEIFINKLLFENVKFIKKSSVWNVKILRKLQRTWAKYKNLVETQFQMSKFRKITKKHTLQKIGGNPISNVEI